MERLVIFPDFLESTNEVYPIESARFDAELAKWIPYGSRNVMNLIGFMDRPLAEERPNSLHVRVRQAVLNALVFVLPDQVYDAVHSGEIEATEAINAVQRHAELLATVKLAGSGETRLVGKLASGVGGHVDQGDFQPQSCHAIDDLLRVAALRELCDEELASDNPDALRHMVKHSLRPLAILNSSFGDVESVHMGFVTVLAVPASLKVRVEETDKLETVMVPLASFPLELKSFFEQRDGHHRLDRWTQLLFGLNPQFLVRKIIASIQS